MGKKIFVSYKYADNDVKNLANKPWYESTTVRDYVDLLEQYFETTDDIYKGESDDEDLSQFSEETIWEKLKDRIYDSSVTIIMISPNMKESYKTEKSQWIPWEVSFSLKETTRNDRTSHTNAILAIVLPDSNGSYEYYLTKSSCGSITHHTDKLFSIIRNNKFNIKEPNISLCPLCGRTHFHGTCSYIEAVKWDDFTLIPNHYIEKALKRQENINDYKIVKEV